MMARSGERAGTSERRKKRQKVYRAFENPLKRSFSGERRESIQMKGTTSMKRILTKLAVVIVLLMALTFVIGGTASARSVSKAQPQVTLSPSTSCPDWVQLSNWTWSSGHGQATIIKWENLCGSWVHCQAIDNSIGGSYGIKIELHAYNTSGTLKKTVSGIMDPAVPGQYINTPSLTGYATYKCDPHLV
jgi:hypothetical protein